MDTELMDEQSDGQLLDRWRKTADQKAFCALVRRHEAALLRHSRALSGDWRGGEDLVQETLLRLAERPPDIPDEARGSERAEHAVLSAWLHTVTRNLSRDAMRSEQRRRFREEEVAPAEAVGGGLGDVEAADTRLAVEQGLSRLPAAQREVLILRLFGERSYREIAEITGRKVGTIGWMISVGLRSLADDLAPLLGMAVTPAASMPASSLEASNVLPGETS